MNENFFDFLKLLNEYEVKYVMVGGWAVIFEGYSRTTRDMDILVEPTENNAGRILVVLKEFFGSAIGFVKEDFTKVDNVIMMGREPYRIDILTSISGVSFSDVFDNSKIYSDEGLDIRCIHINELIRNKEATGRLKDLADASYLKKIRAKRESNKK